MEREFYTVLGVREQEDREPEYDELRTFTDGERASEFAIKHTRKTGQACYFEWTLVRIDRNGREILDADASWAPVSYYEAFEGSQHG